MTDFDPAAIVSGSIERTGTEERDYLLKRADDHRQRAVIARDQGARDIHARLQRLYEERAAVIGIVQHD
jgi:hypothetical protein